MNNIIFIAILILLPLLLLMVLIASVIYKRISSFFDLDEDDVRIIENNKFEYKTRNKVNKTSDTGI